MHKRILFVALALILLLLPLAARWFYFYEGRYEPGQIPRPDLAEIEAPVLEVESFVDRYTVSDAGTILVDSAHSNRFDMAELGILQARLAARGQQLELVQTAEDLDDQLRYAKALIVVSPGEDWQSDEIEQVQGFVDKGGRLLLVTDPTRYSVEFDEANFPILDEDVSHINDLAAQFGVLFQSDYLYNTTENAGNFRNIKLTNFSEHGLAQGLDQIVFYAAHSIRSEEPALISVNGETRSSDSERAENLAVAVLAANGAVLALGDLTFFSEPYNGAYDNDRFVANIADFLSHVERQHDLADFPFFFGDQVDLVYVGDPLIDSNLLRGGSTLQTLFANEGKEMMVREVENEALDTLFFGLYQEAEEVEPYLATAQVTLLMTPTETIKQDEAASGPKPTPSLTLTESVTTTAIVTPAPHVTVIPPAGMRSKPKITMTASVTPQAKGRVRVESLGDMVLTGTLLLFLQADGERQVMVVLADTEKGLEEGIERLTDGNLKDCLLRTTEGPLGTSLALCPAGEVAAGDEGAGWPQPKPASPPPSVSPPVTKTVEPANPTVEPPEGVDGTRERILVIAVDEGEGRYASMTSADNYVAILDGRYEVTVWSKAQDGSLDPTDLANYDLIIWTSGDYEDAYGQEESDLLFLAMLKEIPVIISGAYIGDTDTTSVQRDIQVRDASHPAAGGFEAGEVIGFDPLLSGIDYATDLMDSISSEDGAIVFVRGPDSEGSGVPSIFVFDDHVAGVQVAYVGFPLYLLPEEVGSRLVLNTVAWMLQPNE